MIKFNVRSVRLSSWGTSLDDLCGNLLHFIHKCLSLARKTQQGHFETGMAAGRFICALITVLTQMTAWTGSIKTESGHCLFKKQRQSKEDIWHEAVNLMLHLFSHTAACGTHSGPILLNTDPEEFSALLEHVCQAMGGGKVLVQVSLVRLSQRLLPVHHPLRKAQGKDELTQQD